MSGMVIESYLTSFIDIPALWHGFTPNATSMQYTAALDDSIIRINVWSTRYTLGFLRFGQH